MAFKKKILFLYNGGTIGQEYQYVEGERILFPPNSGAAFKKVCAPIIQKFEKKFEVTFEVITTKDSTNMIPPDWEILINRIEKAQDEEGFDAVGIAHGTDTLPYTGTALALALHGKNSGLQIPICLTGAQNTIYAPGGDAFFNLENLFRVLEVAIDNEVAEVLINFWSRVLLAVRVTKVSESNFDAMNSKAFPNVGNINATGVNLDTSLLRLKSDTKSRKLNIQPHFGSGVVSFDLSPGFEPSVLKNLINSGEISAIILRSLGEGNVCSEGPYSLLPVIKEATEKHRIPVFIVTKFSGGKVSSSHYEVGLKAIEAGGISCYDQTDVTVDVKVRWLIGNQLCSSIEDFKKAMKTSFAGEVTV